MRSHDSERPERPTQADADVAAPVGIDLTTPADVVDGRSLQLLRVDVAGHRCALPTQVVVEIHAAVRLVPLPGAPDVVVGMVNRRGRTVPVVSLRRRLGVPPRPERKDDHLVVLRLGERELAVLVDAAVDVVDVPAATVDHAVARANESLLSQGVAVLPEGLLVVLDATAFLSPGEFSDLDHALQRALATVSA